MFVHNHSNNNKDKYSQNDHRPLSIVTKETKTDFRRSTPVFKHRTSSSIDRVDLIQHLSYREKPIEISNYESVDFAQPPAKTDELNSYSIVEFITDTTHE